METKKLKIGLAGNPNSGKSTVFNHLTGGHAHVGTWPGVTVEKKEGRFQFKEFEVSVVDLPGIYALTAYSMDEKIARDFIIKENPDGIVVIVDASNLERNLYLATQLLELGVNVIIDLNMMDIVRSKGMSIDTKKLSQIFGVPIVETVASKGEGIEELKEAIVNELKKKRDSFRIDYGEDIEMEIDGLEKRVSISGYPSRWMAIKLLEGDRGILEIALREGEAIESQIVDSKKRLEEHLGYDLETALVEKRYAFLAGLIKESVSKNMTS
jgi:ferrous iron transport protein B